MSNTSVTSIVLGQSDVDTSTTNTGGISAATINRSTDVTMVGSKIVVTDAVNNRVLIYDSLSLALGLSADVVTGQSDFVSSSSGSGLNQLDFPLGVASDGIQLFVSDKCNHRVLRY